MISGKLASKRIILIFVLLFIVAAGVLYFYSSKQYSENASIKENSQSVVNTGSALEETDSSEKDSDKMPDNLVSNDSFAYSGNDQLFVVSEKEFKVLERINSSDLFNEAQECGADKDKKYFDGILSKYSADDKGIEYSFRYKGKTQDSGVWKVTVIPNKIFYANLDGFKSDFGLCRAGADMYPTLVSDEWLLLESSCGTGFDDGSGNPHGCEIVREAVAPTIELE